MLNKDHVAYGMAYAVFKWCAGSVAWSMPDEAKRELIKTNSNQYGRKYHFRDGSALWVDSDNYRKIAYDSNKMGIAVGR